MKLFLKILFNLFVFFCFMLFCYPLFLHKTFGPVSFEQFVFHLVNPLKGTDIRLFYKGFFYVGCLPLLLSLIYLKPNLFLPQKYALKNWEYSKKQKWGALILFVGALGFSFMNFRIDRWWYFTHTPTTLYKQAYQIPSTEDISFTTKKNAIVIYLESMENTYNNPSIFNKNYIPELTQLAEKNTSFDRFYHAPGTTWTIAGIFSGMCGIPLRIPMKGVRLDLFQDFLPSAICIPEILQQKGYSTTFLLGSNAQFSGIDNFARQHGFDSYWGIEEIEKEQGSITPEMKGTGWGLNDKTLFEFSKQKILQASQQKKPFFIVISTIDTHFPNGFFNPNDCQRIEGNFTDVVSCSSRLVNQFVEWIQAQPFANETTIILLGDHITMGNDVYNKIKQSNNRQVLNIFINGEKQPLQKENRSFTTFDFAPSILSAMGANLPKDSFGLGRDLFSGRPTLAEEIGIDKLATELVKYAPEYQNFFKKRK